MQYANCYIRLVCNLFGSASRPDLLTILCRSNFFGKLSDKVSALDKKKQTLRANNQDLILVFLRKLFLDLKQVVCQRPDLVDVADSLYNLQNNAPFVGLFGYVLCYASELFDRPQKVPSNIESKKSLSQSKRFR